MVTAWNAACIESIARSARLAALHKTGLSYEHLAKAEGVPPASLQNELQSFYFMNRLRRENGLQELILKNLSQEIATALN